MNVVEILSILFGVVGIGYGIRCYWELYKWARQCQGARISVYYKGKWQLGAPLVEWLLWCNQLNRDKESNGRPVYKMGGTTIAITKAPPRVGLSIVRTIKNVRPRRRQSPTPVTTVTRNK